jgi:hypothetical protein
MAAVDGGCGSGPKTPCPACAKAEVRQDSRGSVGLSYIDLLYAVPVAVVAQLIAEHPSSEVATGVWANVALALAAVTCGWIGHHQNRRHLPRCLADREDKRFFSTARFPQFIIEILIIGVYLALVLVSGLRHPSDSGTEFEHLLTKWLAYVFVLYLVWDLFDVGIARTRSPSCGSVETFLCRAVKGMAVTLGFTVVAVLISACAWTGNRLGLPIIWFDGLLIGFLFAYRWVQEVACG